MAKFINQRKARKYKKELKRLREENVELGLEILAHKVDFVGKDTVHTYIAEMLENPEPITPEELAGDYGMTLEKIRDYLQMVDFAEWIDGFGFIPVLDAVENGFIKAYRNTDGTFVIRITQAGRINIYTTLHGMGEFPIIDCPMNCSSQT